jgi:HD-like signal output (HDOD) protein
MYTPLSLVQESIKLVPLPDVYIRLKQVIDNPDSTMADIAEIIAHEPSITARLLQLVNSSFYGLVKKIDTITHAVNLLGIDEVHDLVLATSMVESFSGFESEHFNIYDFWFNGVYCAVTANMIACQCKGLDSQRSFVSGLLHNMGHLVMYQIIPDETYSALQLSKEKNIELYKAEREILGFDFGQIGAELMREWYLPESLEEILEFQTEPDKADKFKLETAIIHIASLMTRNAQEGLTVSSETLPINPLCWELTKLSIDDMPEIKHQVDQQASMVMSILFTHKKSA